MIAVLFWTSLLLLAFTYVGYPGVMWLRARLQPCPVKARGRLASVDLLLVVHDAATELPRKLENLRALRYPQGLIRINVVCDGCTDATEAIARQATDADLRVFAYPNRRGKSACIGEALPLLDREIVVFSDVRQWIDEDAVQALVAALSDPSVGAASGELILQAEPGFGRGVDAYWRYEKWIRRLESRSGSLVGVTGALYAARRSLIPPVPPGLVLDDMWIPLRIAATGHRVVFVPQAVAHDRASTHAAAEEVRKRRTLSGNYQLLHLWPALMLPGGHPLWWRLWGHKWLRLLAPWLLLVALASNALLSAVGPWMYDVLLALQLAAYALAVAGRAFPAVAAAWLPARLAAAFFSLNASALLALFDYLRNREVHLWQTAPSRGA